MKERLDVLLVKRGLAPSREKAKTMIMEGNVMSLIHIYVWRYMRSATMMRFRLMLRSMRLWNWQNNTEPMIHRHLSMEFLQILQNDETCIFGRAGK